MPRNPITTTSFNAVAAGQTATLALPVGAIVYQGLNLVYGTSTAGGPNRANMEAEIDEIRLKLNGKVQRVMSAAQLFKINEVQGVAVRDGHLPIFLGEPWRRSSQGEDSLAWGMADINDFTIEVDIDAAASSPTLEARPVIERVSRPLGPIVKWRRFTVPVSAVGIVNVTTLPKLDAYLKLHAFSANINAVEVNVDQRQVWDLTKAQMDNLYADNGITLPSGLASLLFDYTGRVSDALPMFNRDGVGGPARQVSEFRVDFDMSAATAFDLITETLGPRD